MPVCRPSCCPRVECNKQTCPGCYKKMVTSPEQCPCVNTGQNNHWTQMSFDVWCLLQVHFLTELMDQQDWTATLGTSSIETTLSWTARITDSTLTRVYFWVSSTIMMRIRVKINIHLNNKYRGFLVNCLISPSSCIYLQHSCTCPGSRPCSNCQELLFCTRHSRTESRTWGLHLSLINKWNILLYMHLFYCL